MITHFKIRKIDYKNIYTNEVTAIKNDESISVIELERKLEEANELINELQIRVEELQRYDDKVVSLMSNNQDTIANWISIVGAVIGGITILLALFTLVIGLFGYNSIKKYFLTIIQEKFQNVIKDKKSEIKSEISDDLGEIINIENQKRLAYWDEKFANLLIDLERRR